MRLSKKLFFILFLSVCLTFAYHERARAFVDTTGQYLAAIAAGSAGASVIAATGGTFLGLTPIGWLAAGTAILAAVLIKSDTHQALVVSTRTIDVDPNPDLSSQPTNAQTSSPNKYPWVVSVGGVLQPYVFFYSSTTSNFSPSSLTADANLSPTWVNFKEYFRTYLSSIGWTYAYQKTNAITDLSVSFAFSTNSYCPSGKCLILFYHSNCPANTDYVCATGTVPSGLPIQGIQGNTSSMPATLALYIPIVQTNGFTCESGSYDYPSGLCLGTPVDTPPNLSDGYCRVSWAPNGCPVFNKSDTDCTAFNVQASCGNSTTPPSVVATDPTTGETLRTQRPVNSTQGTPGAVTITNAVPDPVNNTTQQKQVTTAPPGTPAAPPAVNGTNQATYPGTGTSTSTTPLGSVAISNWPSPMPVTGTVQVQGKVQVECTNCTPEAAEISVQLPDKMKVEPADASENDPEPDDSFPDIEDLFDPIKERLSNYLNFELPEHTSTCTEFTLNTTVVGTHFNNTTNMCTLLERPDFKATVQALMTLIFTLVGITIILRG